MTRAISRRRFLQGSAALGLGLYAGAASASRAVIEETKVITSRPDLYHGWPTVARCKSGRLLVACSGGREGHVCPFGRVELIDSVDDGRTWRTPQVIADGPLDDRDAGVLETPRGTLLVTSFTSLAYEPMLAAAEKLKPGDKGAWPPERLRRWQAARDQLSAEERKAALGTWMFRSTDGGATWSAAYAVPVNSPHGPVTLADGRLFYAGKELWTKEQRIGVCESTDDGVTWRWVATIPTRAGDNPRDYHELHAVDAGDGRLVAQIRNHNRANAGETLQCESSDGGRTWSEPHSIGVWGLPSHLLRLADGRLMMTYGHRRAPLGNQARVSEDRGRTWSEAIVLSGDGISGDLGYPSTVQLADGTLLTVWYESMKGVRAVLRMARWKLTA